jgi:hypothetical protein
MWKEPFLSRRADISEMLAEVFNEEANRLAQETGLIKRVRTLDGADGAPSLIFGWWQEPEIAWEGLRQLLGRREVQLTSSGLSQRLTPEAAECVRRLREDVAARCWLLCSQAPSELLHRFRAVILEERSVVGFARRTDLDLEGTRRPSRSRHRGSQALRAMGWTGWAMGRTQADGCQAERSSPPV